MSHSDILFKNEDVCILHPQSTRGILVFTSTSGKDICSEGIFSYNELRNKHPEFGLQNRHMSDLDHNDLIFFRAPYNNDTSTFESSYDNKSPEDMGTGIAILRIDPNNTFVYLSEARAHGTYNNLQKSRISMKNYLESAIPHLKDFGKGAIRYFYIGDTKLSDKLIDAVIEHGSYITRMFEVVVKLPHIPINWLVYCKSSTDSNQRFQNLHF